MNLNSAKLKAATFWTAVAERSGDTAFERTTGVATFSAWHACKSGVALRFPPQSKATAGESARDVSLVQLRNSK